MASRLPALDWLPRYDPSWLRPDLVAGLTLAAYLLPAGIGDASLAGLAPINPDLRGGMTRHSLVVVRLAFRGAAGLRATLRSPLGRRTHGHI